MKIAVVGATGNIGSHIVSELAERGHQVTGIARNVEGKPLPPGARLISGSVAEAGWLASTLRGHDLVISALHFETIDAPSYLTALKNAGVSRFLVVGGAASLYLPDGSRLIDSPEFPKEWLSIAIPGVTFVDALRPIRDVDWVFVSPPALIGPGERTGKYRLGTTRLLADANGDSRISYADYAIAMADEAEHPGHHHEQITVAY
ncbi:NAD(P)-dependent oxidoreductase [Flaviflagellibacter deserti]|uniref:NAD(P)-dependent oxidoreductase n=1 Tax=Flaviflagellibacter deserti TaxID=2267266 RepID=A0ABV9YXS9_9HYPH